MFYPPVITEILPLDEPAGFELIQVADKGRPPNPGTFRQVILSDRAVRLRQVHEQHVARLAKAMRLQTVIQFIPPQAGNDRDQAAKREIVHD